MFQLNLKIIKLSKIYLLFKIVVNLTSITITSFLDKLIAKFIRIVVIKKKKVFFVFVESKLLVLKA